jgi:hypothetical protein
MPGVVLPPMPDEKHPEDYFSYNVIWCISENKDFRRKMRQWQGGENLAEKGLKVLD